MYAKFFGLNQDPFSIAPDPRFLFMSERHREALAHLLYGVGSGGGFVLLSGDIGTGKTTVCRCFLEQIPENCNVAYIFNPKLSVPELLRSICDEFHIALPLGATTAKDFIDPLNAFLLTGHAAGKNSLLIIDEAQNLSAEVLEQLRLLTNLETTERKLLQIVLIGQPQLRRMLARAELEQLAQRVIARFHLDALSAAETAHYIAHRLAVGGMTGASPFDSQALKRIQQLSRGVPRRINLLCGRALLGAYASGTAQVDRRMVNQAAAEVFGPDLKPDQPAGTGAARPSWRSRWSPTAAALAGLMAGVALLAAVMGGLLSPGANDQGTRDKVAALSLTPAPVKAASVTVSSANRTVPHTPLLDRNDFNALVSASPFTQNQAWQTLGQAWGLTLDGSDACKAALQQGAACFSSRQTPVSLIRELDRPGILTLVGNDTRNAYAVLTGLTGDSATLRLGTQTLTVSLAALADTWRGDFATLRRVPAGYVDRTINGQTGPALAWLAAELDRLSGTTTPAGKGSTTDQEALVRTRVYAFQVAHGLPPDGQAGPMTLMQLNRATGIREPSLTTRSP